MAPAGERGLAHEYRGWVYGLGFGVQLGLGVVTIVTTAAVYLTWVAAFVVAGPALVRPSAPAFGLARALPVLAAASVRTPEAIGARVAGVDARAGRFRVVTVSAEAVAAVTLRRGPGGPLMRADPAHGIDVSLPAGWDGRITVRADGAPEAAITASGTRVATLRSRPVVHLANFGLPADRGDFGSGAVELMGDRDVFVVLFEYEPDAAADRAVPRARGSRARSTPRDFDPRRCARGIAGQSRAPGVLPGVGRAFCLYVVLGAHARRAALVPLVNRVLGDPCGSRPGRRVASSPNGCLGRSVPDRRVAARGRGRGQGRSTPRRPSARCAGFGSRFRRRPCGSAARSRSSLAVAAVAHGRAGRCAALVAALVPRCSRRSCSSRSCAACRSARAAASARSTRRRACCTWW